MIKRIATKKLTNKISEKTCKKTGFTLAEVLITLGIIGVVAAMTIPNLISNINGAKYRNQFKKAISTLSQAARLNLAQYDWDYSGLTAPCGSNGGTQTPETHSTVCAILNGNLTGATYYTNATDIKTKDGTAYAVSGNYFTSHGFPTSSAQAYQLADGTIIAISKSMGNLPCTLDIGKTLNDIYDKDGNMRYCYGWIDVNGSTLPNKEVSCTSGSNSLAQNTCIVKNNVKDLTDVFPIRLHDGIVEPATAAGRYILKTAK